MLDSKEPLYDRQRVIGGLKTVEFKWEDKSEDWAVGFEGILNEDRVNWDWEWVQEGGTGNRQSPVTPGLTSCPAWGLPGGRHHQTKYIIISSLTVRCAESQTWPRQPINIGNWNNMLICIGTANNILCIMILIAILLVDYYSMNHMFIQHWLSLFHS